MNSSEKSQFKYLVELFTCGVIVLLANVAFFVGAIALAVYVLRVLEVIP